MDNRISMEEFLEFVVPVTESGCWIWVGSPQEDGERANAEWENVRPDRFLWEVQFGHIPTGQSICHKCNVQCCVNPNHLYLKAVEGGSGESETA